MGVSDYAAIDETAKTNEVSGHSATDWNCLSPAILLLDKDLRIREWNQSAEIVLGFSADEAEGQSLGLIFKAEQFQQIQNLCQLVLTTDDFDSCLSSCVDKFGQSVTCECLVAVEAGGQGDNYSLTLFDPEIVSEADRAPDRVLAALNSLESVWLAY